MGEKRSVKLELKILADVGLLGKPNSGKSSLVRSITSSVTKIANYEFTTLNPSLAVVNFSSDSSFVISDIPGLIKGAHQGVGLGDEFLKHIQRTRVLVHVVDGSEDNIIERIISINNEISRFDAELAKKPQILVINKFDLDEVSVLESEIIESVKSAKGLHSTIVFVSAATYAGMNELKHAMSDYLEQRGQQKTTFAVSNEDAVIIKPKVKKPEKVIVRNQNGSWRIVHQKAVRLARGSNLETWEARIQFQHRLEQLKVTKALRSAGIEIGDTVMVGDWEFNWD